MAKKTKKYPTPLILEKASRVQVIGPLKLSNKENFNPQIPTIFVDGGIVHFDELDIKKMMTITIGDGDSIPNNFKLRPTLLYSPHKDESDFSLALNLIKAEFAEIILDGFSDNNEIEKRPDHALAIIGEAFLHSQKWKSTIHINQNMSILPKGRHELSVFGTFSLFSLYKLKFKLVGEIKYPIEKIRSLRPFTSLGLSNIGQGNASLYTSEPILLIRNIEN